MGTVAQRNTQKERIRGHGLSVFVKESKGLPFEEGLMRADTENRTIASNSRLSYALLWPNHWSGRWKSIREVFECWSGTMTAYVEPGQKLGKQVEYVDPETGYRWVFAVPESHRGKKNAILVAEHPDYNLEIDGKNRVVHAMAADLVENFPGKDGWYGRDQTHDIPEGKEVQYSSAARYLWRIDKRVGPVERGLLEYGRKQYIGLSSRPARRLGMAVEVPLKDTKKIKSPRE